LTSTPTPSSASARPDIRVSVNLTYHILFRSYYYLLLVIKPMTFLNCKCSLRSYTNVAYKTCHIIVVHDCHLSLFWNRGTEKKKQQQHNSRIT
jgi:hypothetical protein